MGLNKKQKEWCEQSEWAFPHLRTLFLNCTLKRSPERSHTQGLVDIWSAIMSKNGVSVVVLRPVDYNIAYWVWPDMREHGWSQDDWPDILKNLMAAQRSSSASTPPPTSSTRRGSTPNTVESPAASLRATKTAPNTVP